MTAFFKKRNHRLFQRNRWRPKSGVHRRAKIIAELAYHATLVAFVIYNWK